MKTSWGLVIVAVAAAWISGGPGCSSSGGNRGGGAGAGGAAGGVAGNAGLGGSGGERPASGGSAGTGIGGTAIGTGGGLAGGRGGLGGSAASGGGAGGRDGATTAVAGIDGGAGWAGGAGTAGRGAASGGRGGAGAAGGSTAGAGGAAAAPDVLILLDRSSSMNELVDGTTCASGDCGANSKWSLVKTALEGALPLYDATVRWSLKLFASSSGSATTNTCVVSQGVEISPGFSNAAAIAARLDAVIASSNTPTTAAETAAANYLTTIVDGAPKYILLITDGIPTCGVDACAPGATGQISNQCDDANAIAAVKAAHDTAGIPTMVVGIGTDLGTGVDTLEQMAMAGGLPRSSSPTYYPVQTTADLMSAIQALTAAAVP